MSQPSQRQHSTSPGHALYALLHTPEHQEMGTPVLSDAPKYFTQMNPALKEAWERLAVHLEAERDEWVGRTLHALEELRRVTRVDEWDESDQRALDYSDAYEILGEERAGGVMEEVGDPGAYVRVDDLVADAQRLVGGPEIVAAVLRLVTGRDVDELLDDGETGSLTRTLGDDPLAEIEEAPDA